MKRLIVLSGLILSALFLAACVTGEMVNGQAEATFIVRWYDVGAYALEGRSGVLSVERGWRGSSEINQVVFDPEKIDVGKMEKLLKKSGTYIITVEDPEKDLEWKVLRYLLYSITELENAQVHYYGRGCEVIVYNVSGLSPTLVNCNWWRVTFCSIEEVF